MKTLKQLRSEFGTLISKVRTMSYGLDYLFNERTTLDFDVYLPTRGINLQRELVWSLEQKQEFIMSIIYGRHIPNIALINTSPKRFPDRGMWKRTFEVIDGKQRLTTLKDYLDDKFTIVLEGTEFKYSELPEDYKSGAFRRLWLNTYEYVEDYDNFVSDDDKVAWFKFINFAGVPQDKEHFNKLSNLK